MVVYSLSTARQALISSCDPCSPESLSHHPRQSWRRFDGELAACWSWPSNKDASGWYDTQDKIETLIPGVQPTQFPTAPLGWLVPGDPTSPNGGGKLTRTLAPTDYKEFGPRIGLPYSPNTSEGFLGKIVGGRGKTSIRAAYGIYYTATEDLTLSDIVADAPYGQFWVAPQPPLMQEPSRTRSDGSWT